MWLNRLFIDLANSHEKQCLTIDCGNKNKNGPCRYRSSADNPDEQVWYFNKPNDNEYYNVFIGKRIKEGDFSEAIYFKIEKVRRKTDKENFDAKKLLEVGTNNDRFSQIFSMSKPNQLGVDTAKRHGDPIGNLYRRDRKSARSKFLSRL